MVEAAMIRCLRLFIVLALMFATSQTFAGIAIKSEYSYNQQGITSFSGGEEVVGDINRQVNLPNAIYKFDIVSSSGDVYELKSKAKIEANIDGRAIGGFSGDGWASTEMRAFSSTQLIDTAIVDGIQGQFGGIVEFLWDVTGVSTISLDPKLRSDAYGVNELYTTALFTANEEGAIPELSLNNESQPPIGTSSVDSVVADFFEPVVVAVDWLAGEELDVFFELQTTARLSVDNFDAAGFEAVVDSDFSNTAVLQEIRIRDQDGNLIPDAYLLGEDGFIYDPAGLGLGSGGGMSPPNPGPMNPDPMSPTPMNPPVVTPVVGGGSPTPGAAAVPEPATIVIWLALAGIVGVRVVRRSK